MFLYVIIEMPKKRCGGTKKRRQKKQHGGFLEGIGTTISNAVSGVKGTTENLYSQAKKMVTTPVTTSSYPTSSTFTGTGGKRRTRRTKRTRRRRSSKKKG
jgi:hypothetical protein